MAVKEVYAIRINKDDLEIKRYLEQFPERKQTKALKSLLKYGAERLQEDYVRNQEIHKLQETIQSLQEKQEQKLEEIIKLISKLQIRGKIGDETESSTVPEEDTTIDTDKVKKAMQEALLMFSG